MQKFLEGAEKCSSAYFCFVSAEGTIVLGGSGSVRPRKYSAKLHSKTRDFSAF